MQVPDICEAEKYQPVNKIFDKFCQKLKGLPFYGEWTQKRQTFR